MKIQKRQLFGKETKSFIIFEKVYLLSCKKDMLFISKNLKLNIFNLPFYLELLKFVQILLYPGFDLHYNPELQ